MLANGDGRKRTPPAVALVALGGRLRRWAAGVCSRRERARLEVGVGFAAAALAYDFYALGGGYGFG